MSSIIVRKRKVFRSARVVTRGGRVVTKRWTVPKKVKKFTEEKRVLEEQSVVHVDGINDVVITEEEPKQTATTAKYSIEKKKRISKWTTLRQPFLALGRSLFAPQLKCTVCMEETEEIFRCLDCCQWDVLCLACLQQRHCNPHLHLFEGWKNGTFLSFNSSTPVWKHGGYCENEKYQYGKDVVIIDDKGRQHIRTLTFCMCEEESLCMLRFGLWPATPNLPTVAFSMELLKWIQALSMDCQVSVKGFCQAVKSRLTKHHQLFAALEIKNIYQILVKETLAEFRFFLHQMEHLSDVHPDLSDGTQCAACYKVTKKVVSLDADFQLVRKASSGKTWSSPKHAGMFVEQSEVDTFIQNYPSSTQVEKDCSDFQAGNSVRSKNKTCKLSETAVFGSACRHDFPHIFFSLKHGERIGYSVFLLRKLLQHASIENKHLHVMYDIACVLKAHLKVKINFKIDVMLDEELEFKSCKVGAKNPQQQDLLEKIDLSIPIFHCYGHKASCQVLFSPRRTEGFGLSDGEGMERIWSFLGKFSSITKEMTPESRTDLLSQALIHFGQHIDNNFSSSLVRKIKKASEVESTSRTALQEVLSTLPGYTVADVWEWANKQKEIALKKTVDVTYTKEENYSIILEKLFKMQSRRGLGGREEQRLESKAKQLERQLGINRPTVTEKSYIDWLTLAHDKQRQQLLTSLHRMSQDYQYLIELNRKYSRGQSIAIRLSRQMKKAVEEMNRTISCYNDLASATVSSHLPPSLTFEEVRNPDNPLWQNSNSELPSSLKNQAVQFYFMLCRSEEEQDMIREEMKSVMAYYENQHCLLMRSFSDADRVLRPILLLEGLHLEQKNKNCAMTFQPFIENVTLLSQFTSFLGFHENQSYLKMVQDFAESECLLNTKADEDSEDEESEDEL